MVKVEIGPLTVYTGSDEMAECLEALAQAYYNGEVEDFNCVYRALNYIKKYYLNRPGAQHVIQVVEETLIKAMEKGELDPWERR